MEPGKDTAIRDFVRGVQIRANIIAFFRLLYLPLGLLILLGLLMGSFNDFINQTIFREQTAGGVKIIAFICIIAILTNNLRRPFFWHREKTIALIESENGLTETAPLSTEDEKLISGDKSLWELSNLRKSAALKQLRAPKLFTKKDLIISAILFVGIGLLALNPVRSFDSLRPNFAIIFDGSRFEINANAAQPEYTNRPNLDLNVQRGKIELAQGSKVEIVINGAKSAPRISYGSFSIRMRKDGANTWRASLSLNKSGKLKVHRFGVQKSWPIKISQDKPPQIDNDFEITPQGDSSLNVKISAADDYGIKSAELVLRGKNNVQTIIDIDPATITLGAVSNLNIKAGHSALVGQKVSAHIELEDDLGQKTKSKGKNFELARPIFNSLLANALQEIRLLILLETKDYRRTSSEYMLVNDDISGGKIKIISDNNIKFAPANIIKAYEILGAIYSVRPNLGLSLSQNIGLTHAIKSLEYARKREDAIKVADTLWSIIETFEQNKLDSRSKVANAIENLKSALKNGANEEEIENLKSELKAAINEHLQALSDQSGESGDMELAQSETIGHLDLNQLLDEAQKDSNSGNNNDAAAKLDELNQMLSQMQPGGGGQGQSVQIDGLNQSGAMDPLSAQQQSILQDTQNANPNDLSSLIQRQEDLLSKIEPFENSDSPNDQSLNEARAAMGSVLEALKNNDLQTAQMAQQAAIEALKQRGPNQDRANDNAGDNKDPLGRQMPEQIREQTESGDKRKSNSINSQSPNKEIDANGRNDGRATKLPNASSPIRSNEILNRLRERLSRPNQSEEERNYLENAISNQ